MPLETVHPRVCGEHEVPNPPARSRHGSSPRVWGTYNIGAYTASITRFIPACVGNMTDFGAEVAVMTVHPRVCGEHQILRTDVLGHAGSSPRVWGT